MTFDGHRVNFEKEHDGRGRDKGKRLKAFTEINLWLRVWFGPCAETTVGVPGHLTKKKKKNVTVILLFEEWFYIFCLPENHRELLQQRLTAVIE